MLLTNSTNRLIIRRLLVAASANNQQPACQLTHEHRRAKSTSAPRSASTTNTSKGQSISISSIGAAHGIAASPPMPDVPPKLDLTFEDSRTAFKSKSTLQLLRGYLVFQLCSLNFIVDNQKIVSLLFD